MGKFQSREGAEVVSIQGIGSSGEGVGTLDGLKIFVDGALPKEQVRVVPVARKPRYAKGHLLEVVTPSPHRIDPVCPLFGRCGGCQLMHADTKAQLQIKRQRVVDALHRLGKLDVDVAPCRQSPEILGYRNKIQMPVVEGRVGLYARRTNQIVPVDRCYIHCDLGEKVLDHLRPLLTYMDLRTLVVRTAIRNQEVAVVLVTRQGRILREWGERILRVHPTIRSVMQNINRSTSSTIFGKEWHRLSGSEFVHETLSGLTLRLGPASFMQVNTLQAEQLYVEAIQLAEISPGTRVADLYCGIGALSLLAAKEGGEVMGVESVPQAIENARENGRLNGIRARFVCEKAEIEYTKLGHIDVAFLNPPRKGCALSLLEVIDAHRIVYISCDPATLARDLKFLTAKGYRLDCVIPFDMFPQTAHVEVVCRLIK